MSRGLGKVQRYIIEDLALFPSIPTDVHFLHSLSGFASPSISRALASLEERGLVVRCEDGEAVKLTSKGLGAWARLQDGEI